MKKTILLFALLASVTFGLFAQEDSGKSSEPKEGWSNMTYVNVPILKVLEGREGYVVIYQKNKTGIGNTVIPKNWAHGTPDDPAKLKFRKLEPGLLQPYMTVVKKGGDFHRVILTMPLNKSNAVWGLVDYHKNLEGTDKETLEDLKF